MNLQPDKAAGEAEAAALRWHGGWVVACLAATGAVLLIAGRVPGPMLAAFAALVGAGVLGRLLIGYPRITMSIWTATALFAVGAAGGLTGPGAAWCLLPIAAGVTLGRGWRESAVWAAAVALLAGAAQAAAVTADLAEGLAAGAAALASVGTTIWALVSAGRERARSTLVVPLADPREAARARALALELEATRAEVQALRDEAHAAGEDLERLRGQAEASEAGRLEAEAANAAKSRFLATMSHELRTPLNAVMGFADIMRNRLFGPLPDRYGEYSQLIHESGAHLLDLINDVLDLSKIEADQYRLERERFDAREAMEAVLKLVRNQADEAGVLLQVDLPNRPLNVEADKRAVKQIALNLLANALKFTPAGGEVRLSLAESDGALVMVVADTGLGIAPEDLERLGRPYEQAGDADTRALGTGLGLSLVRAFSALHEGEMSLESELGEGTAVTVRLPVMSPDADLFAERGETAQVIPFSTR